MRLARRTTVTTACYLEAIGTAGWFLVPQRLVSACSNEIIIASYCSLQEQRQVFGNADRFGGDRTLDRAGVEQE
jgi:hypothetical protein